MRRNNRDFFGTVITFIHLCYIIRSQCCYGQNDGSIIGVFLKIGSIERHRRRCSDAQPPLGFSYYTKGIALLMRHNELGDRVGFDIKRIGITGLGIAHRYGSILTGGSDQFEN